MINSTSTNTVIDHAEIEYASTAISVDGTNITISNTTLRNFGGGPYDAGIYMENGAGGLISSNDISTTGALNEAGISLNQSAPHIVGNTIQNMIYGISARYGSHPVIDGDNLITNNTWGIEILGDSWNAANDPMPDIHGNSIYGNTLYNVSAEGFASPTILELDVTDNWWGSVDPNDFIPTLFGFKDGWTTNTPLLKVAPFRAAPGGPLQTGNYLNGMLADGLIIGTGETVDAVGALVVPAGGSVAISAGATLRFASDSVLYVRGQLQVQGTAASRAVFTSSAAIPAPDIWSGIAISNSDNANDKSTFSNALFEYAGVSVYDGSADISDSEFQYSRISMGVETGGVIAGNILDGHNTVGSGIGAQSTNLSILGNHISNYTSGIYVYGGDPAIRANTIDNNQTGILIDPAPNDAAINASITSGNLITQNTYGIHIMAGGSQSEVAINNNSIYANQTYNLYAQSYGLGLGATHFIDATRNWWGSDDVPTLMSTIYDQTDAVALSAAANAPFVDFSPFLDASSTSVEADILLGVLDGSRAIDENTSYSLQGSVLIPPGTTLTMGAGAQLLFPLRSSLVVKGALASAGTKDNPTIFSSSKPPGTQAARDWYGIIVKADNVAIENTRIEYADHGISVIASQNAYIADCRISDFYSEAILMTYEDVSILRMNSSGSIIGNTITQNLTPQGTGIYVLNSSPLIANNIISETSTGMLLRYANASDVTGNIIRNNRNYGIELRSGFLATPGSTNTGTYPDPKPTINRNSIYDNNYYAGSSYNLYINRRGLNNYSGNPGTYVLDATNNWWNAITDSEITSTQFISTDRASIIPTISYVPFYTGPIAFVPTLDTGPTVTNDPLLSVTGQAEPGIDVRIYVNGAQQAQVTTDSGGHFSTQVTLAEGGNTLYATAVNGSGESNASPAQSVILDTQPPVITVMTPLEGQRTSSYPNFSGTLNEPATLSIAGQPALVSITNTFSHGPIPLTEGSNAIPLHATDLAGNVGSLTVNVTLDSTPPPDPVSSMISFGAPSGGQTTVNGAAGSVQAGSIITLVNARSGQTSQTTAAGDGSFTLTIDTVAGDNLELVVADDVGNQASWLGHTVTGMPPPLSLSVSAPLNNATVAGNSVHVIGTLNGPANSGVVVNGIVATLEGGTFVAADVPITADGATILTLTATDPDGATATESITVNSVTGLPVELSVAPDNGLNPLPVTFELERVGTFDIGTVEIDLDGDGTYDLTGSDITYTFGLDALGNYVVLQASASHVYETPGLYTAKVRITGTAAYSGISHILDHPVVVQDAIGVGSNLRRIYNRMLNNLIAGNSTGALSALSQTMQDKFTSLFTNPAVDFALLVPQLGEVVGGGISSDLGYLVVKRTEGAQDLYFTIYFSRGLDGVWRIGEM